MEDHEVARFRGQMKLLQRRLRREALPVHGVSRTAWQVITAVVRLPAGARPREIAAELHMTSSNVAAALRELETAGYVLRSRDPADARQVSVSVTEQGHRVVVGVRSERDTWLGRAVETLLDQDEQRVLLAAGELMRRLAEFEQPDPAETPDRRAPDRRTGRNAS
jgi:DNA-binding MarR family transcriptional regulator